MYYLLIVLSVVMFGGCFKLNDLYRVRMGTSLKVSLHFALISSLAALPVLGAICKFAPTVTPFTLLIAALSAVNGVLFSFCSFKALGRINLSLYSLFSMLGGMALPFVQGILFFEEELTVAKSVCFVLIALALAVTVKPVSADKKGGFIYYVGVFVLNGMSGVLSKIFVSAPFEKSDSYSFSFWSAVCSVLLSLLVLAVILLCENRSMKFTSDSDNVCAKQKKVPGVKTIGIAAANGVINKLANLILVISLAFVDTSVQYPMVTGGVIIVSTLICFFDKEKKPKKSDIISVIIAFFGTLALFLIPV